MDETKENIIKKRRDFTVYSLIFLLGFLGGIFGSFVYLDYRGFKLESSGLTSFSNVKVEETSAVIEVAEKVSPGVVSITGVQERLDFFGNASQSKSSGTGFIVSKDGLIITNKHVISEQNAKYSVFTNDGKEYAAEIKALDPSNDLAFIKINATDLPVVELGSSDDIKVGQKVVAIGNALGQYQNSVTTGIISGVSRAIQAGDGSGTMTESLENVIQTDAAINPGNSGGPLVNIAGQVIGINTAIDQQGESIGFAIPINVAKSALESVLTRGKIVRPMLGVRYIPITKDFATRNGLSVNQGAYIYGGGEEAIVPASPAALAGLKEGDVITKMGDKEINSQHSLAGLLSQYNVGDRVQITYYRDGKERKVDVVLQESRQ